jgi:hypothetical protein
LTLLVSLASIVPAAQARGTSSAASAHVSAGAQDLPPFTYPDLTIEQVRGAFASSGYQTEDPITWHWTSPPVSTLHVRDLGGGRVLVVLVYLNADAALTARRQAQTSEQEHSSSGAIASGRGPHLVMGYGESVWLSNLAMVETTQSELNRLHELLEDRDNGVYVNPEHLQEMSRPTFAVDPDFLQALTNSIVNL